LRQGLVQVQEGFLGRPVEEESEEFLVKLKLLLEGKLVRSLVNLRLLAEMKVDSTLVKLGFLLGQGEIELLGSLKLLVALMGSFLVKLTLLLEEGVIGSLVKLRSLLEQKMVEPLENLEKKFPWVDSPMFPLQILNKE
jgi:hypothetical protein